MGYTTLKAALDAVVKTNGRQEVTGQNLNGVMTTLLQGVDIMDRSNPADTSGLNKVVLKKSRTFAQQVISTNTIYEIRDVFDLGGTSFTIPSGCYFLFNGGKLLNANLSGSVLNEELKPEWFGAAADGNTDDASALYQCINLAIASNAIVSLEKDKTYAVKTEKIFYLSEKNATINGNGATIQVTSPGYIQFLNSRYAQVQCPQNLVRGTAAITFSSLPAGLHYGDIINIASSEIGENSYNTRKQQTTRVGKIVGNTIYLSDTILMDSASDTTTLSFYKPASVTMKNLRVMCNRGGLNASMRFDYIIPFFDGIVIDGTETASYGIVIHGCLDGVIKNGTNAFITYGYLVNASAHLLFENIFCPALQNHPVAIATFSNYICVRRLTGVGQLIESHTGFNITYEDCVIGCSSSAGWNMRAVGFTLRRCRIFSYDGTKVQPSIIGSVALYDTSIYYDYSARFEDCVLPMDEITINHSGLIEFFGCDFLPNARINLGAAGASIVRKGRIFRCDNVKYVTIHTNNYELETDREEFDAVKNDNGEYEISLALASFKMVEANGQWRGHGRINNYDMDNLGEPVFPIKLYPQRSLAAGIGSGELYVTFEFTIYTTNRASGSPFCQRTYVMDFWYYPKYNDGAIVRITDTNPDETLVSATISDFAFSGVTQIPEEQCISFNINMKTSIPSFGAARNTIVYDCKVVGRNW